MVGIVDHLAGAVLLEAVDHFIDHTAPEELADECVVAVIHGFQVFGLQIIVFGAAGIFLDAVAARVILVAVGRDAVDLHLADAVVSVPGHADGAGAADGGHAAVVVVAVFFVHWAGGADGIGAAQTVGGVDVVV